MLIVRHCRETRVRRPHLTFPVQRVRRREARKPAGNGRAFFLWSDGRRRRCCSARLLDAGRAGAEFLVFGTPEEGAEVRIKFREAPRSDSGVVVNIRPGPTDDGPALARVALEPESAGDIGRALRGSGRRHGADDEGRG
jgi:hypothetical protein